MSDEQKKEEAQLKKQLFRGRRARIFLNSDTWIDLSVELGEDQIRLERENVWAPGRTATPEAWAMLSAYNSGRTYEIGRLLELFERWIRDGQEAETKLKELGIDL